MNIKFPLMKNNIYREDLDLVIEYLKQEDPVLTQSKNVEEFEKKWSDWLGIKYSMLDIYLFMKRFDQDNYVRLK